MASEAKNAPIPPPSSDHPPPKQEVGVKIFSYPKMVFLYPTMIMALICGLGMTVIKNNTVDPTWEARHAKKAATPEARPAPPPAQTTTDDKAGVPNPTPAQQRRFFSPQNVLAVAFLVIFAFNMMVMALDFPRFTIVAGILAIIALAFFLLWLGAQFNLPLWAMVIDSLESIYAVANAQFYFLFGAVLLMLFGIIYVTRWLDFWEILPNEILHHHGPLSDLERYPTINVKFDKEIPDVFEFLMLRSGRIVLQVANTQRPIVLDNVPFINSIERKLKTLMSGLEVRVTPDREVSTDAEIPG